MALTPEQLETLATKPQSASNDSGSMTARSADDVLKLRDAAATEAALADGRSAFDCLRPRVISSPGPNR